jgi:hypothetical protein
MAISLNNRHHEFAKRWTPFYQTWLLQLLRESLVDCHTKRTGRSQVCCIRQPRGKPQLPRPLSSLYTKPKDHAATNEQLRPIAKKMEPISMVFKTKKAESWATREASRHLRRVDHTPKAAICTRATIRNDKIVEQYSVRIN